MIPKIIHFCWLSDDEYPPLIKKCLNTWQKMLPDYEFMLWDKNRFDINSTLWTQQAYDTKKYAFASDYIRFHALYNHGGIYLDTDVEVLKRFDSLLHLPYFIGNQFDNIIEAAVIGTEKHSDWALECLKYYENRPFIKANGDLDLLILPIVMREQISLKRTIKAIDMETDNLGELLKDEDSFYVFNHKYFSPKNHQTGKFFDLSNAFTIHHYNGSWIPFLSRTRLKLIKVLGVNNSEKVIDTLGLRKIRDKSKNLLR